MLAGKYRLGELVGQGAHGAVYRATHEAMERQVAVKILHPGRLSEVAVRRFEQEARHISQLKGSSTINVYDYGVEGERFYLVMEWVDGVTLAQLLGRDGALAPARAIALTLQVLDGLEEAHHHHILHRDLKPANIMIERDFRGTERVKLLDFGVAKVLADARTTATLPQDEPLTQEDTFVGTPRYAAPEQFNAQGVCAATDLWAIGAILWEMLTGEPLNPHGQFLDCARFHVRRAHSPLKLPEAIPATLRPFMERALQPEPGARWPDAATMRRALAQARSPHGASQPAPPPLPAPTPPLPDMPSKSEQSAPVFNQLLQGKDAWWHFMAAKAQGERVLDFDAGDGEELELELVGRMAQRESLDNAPKFHPHHTSSLRCHACSAEVPSDMTFCVYCAAPPSSLTSARGQVLVIEEITQESLLDELAEMLAASSPTLGLAEVRSALLEPPGVFFFPARDEYAQALVSRLAEIGVRASLSHQHSAEVGMVREVFESVLRDRRALGIAAFLLCAWAALAIVLSPLFCMAGIVLTLLALGAIQYRRFETRYELDVDSALNGMTGMTSDIKERAQRGLVSVQDKEVRQLLTLCLIEYYAIWRQLASAPPAMRPLLGELRKNLHELVHQILDACLRYGELHSYAAMHDLEELEREASKLGEQLLALEDAESRRMLRRQIDQRERKLLSLREVHARMPPFKQRLQAMCSSLESLRARVVSMTLATHISSSDEVLVQQVMLELDDEFAVFEQTLAEVEISS